MAVSLVHEQPVAAPDHASPTAETVEDDSTRSGEVVVGGSSEYKAEFDPNAAEAQEDLRSFARIHMVLSSWMSSHCSLTPISIKNCTGDRKLSAAATAMLVKS